MKAKHQEPVGARRRLTRVKNILRAASALTIQEPGAPDNRQGPRVRAATSWYRDDLMTGIVTPWAARIRFESGRVPDGSYCIIRWTDRYGTCWEHQLGRVRQVKPSDAWARAEVPAATGSATAVPMITGTGALDYKRKGRQ